MVDVKFDAILSDIREEDGKVPQKNWRTGMSSRAFISSDLLEPGLTAEGIVGIVAGAGAAIGAFAGFDHSDHPGVWCANTGTTAAGRVFLISRAGAITLGSTRGRFGAWVQPSSLLSTALERYVLRAGLGSITLPNTILFGIFFEYTDNENGGRWQALCEDGVAETSVDTGITVVGLQYYKLEWEINAAGTSVEFFIDDVSVATITTNIPTGVANNTFVNIHIMKLVGTTTRPVYWDAYYWEQDVTR